MIKVRFVLPGGEVICVNGEAGMSVMQVALDHGVPGIEAECGGCLSCGTCHAYIGSDYTNQLPPPEDMELTMLEHVIDPAPSSRLTCQIILSAELDGVEVTIPD